MPLRKSLTRQVSKPFRVFKAFSPKSKGKSQDAGSPTTSETASIASDGNVGIPPVPSVPAQASESTKISTPSIAKVVVVEAQIIEDADRRIESNEESGAAEPVPEAKAAPEGKPEEQRGKHEVDEEGPIVEAKAESEGDRNVSPAQAQQDAEPESSLSEPQNVASAVETSDATELKADVEIAPASSDVGIIEATAAEEPEVQASDSKADVVETLSDVVIVEVEQAVAMDAATKDDAPVTPHHVHFVTDEPLDTSAAESAVPVTVVSLFDVDENDDERNTGAKDMDDNDTFPSPVAIDANVEPELADPAASIDPFIKDDEKPLPSPLLQSLPDASTNVSHPLSEYYNAPLPLNVDKDVPPSPPPTASSTLSDSSSTSTETAAPVIHAPGLLLPTLFLPIPNVRPLPSLFDSICHFTRWLATKVPSPLSSFSFSMSSSPFSFWSSSSSSAPQSLPLVSNRPTP